MKKFWKIIAATFTMSSAFGAQSVFACARTLELPEFFSWKFPIVLNVDSEKVVSENTYFIEPAINQDFATIFVKEGVTKSVFKLYSDFDSFEASLSKNNKRPFEEIVNRVNLGKAETIAPLISSEKDLKRSIKFVEMMGIKDLQIKCIVSVPTGENKNQDLNMYLCVFFESKSSKLRPDMNYIDFEF